MSTPVPGPLGVIAHYNLLERLEPAGPGELFRARDTRHGRTVTVRLLPPDFTDDRSRPAFIEQARGLAALSHPNVTVLFDVGEHDRQIFLVFEFLTGQSLRLEMGGRPLNVRRAVDLAIAMADAVGDAHAHGYVHGGLSPDSVVITTRGHAKIPASSLATRTGFTSSADGRLHDYDAPEEARGIQDERSDIYSVGAVLYETLTGKRPLHRGSAAPSATNTHVPRELDDIVLRAVSPNPERRHESAAAFAADLRRVAAIVERRGGLDDDPDVELPSAGRRRGFLVPATVVLIAIAAIAWFLRFNF